VDGGVDVEEGAEEEGGLNRDQSWTLISGYMGSVGVLPDCSASEISGRSEVGIELYLGSDLRV
jgi:hypothetical protein